MSKTPNDRRTIRTKKMIRKALAELIEEKGFNDITITDLTTRADINRGTFYLHYTDKFDLLEKIEDEAIQEIYKHLEKVSPLDIRNMDSISNMGSINKPIPFMIKIFEYLKENSVVMKAVLGPKGDLIFHSKLKKLIETNLFEKKPVKTFKKENMLIPEEYFISYLLSAHLGVIQQWLESGMKESPEEMALILAKMFLLGPFKVGGLKSISDL